MSDLVRLHAQKGTDECNIGTNRYTIHDDGFFYIPRAEQIDGLLKVGGFTVAADQTPNVIVSASRLAELERFEVEAQTAPATHRLIIPS